MTRILVTGSRDWTDQDAVWKQLFHAILEATGRPAWDQEMLAPPADFVIVHGDYKRGVDHLTRIWCEQYGVNQDPHPAAWRRYGPRAGPKRNQEMVDLGADMCLAFPLGREWSGTRDCMKRARSARIDVFNFGDEP